MKWKRWEIALAASLLAGMLICSIPIEAQNQLAGKLTRLHVLANSDSEADQALKLKVRDAVLKASAGKTEVDSALLSQLEKAAQQTLIEEGSRDSVHVSREKCYFETRVYDTFSLPAGYYDAVRVVIGEGKGKNWWCVIYPPLCAGVCEKDLRELATEAGLTKQEIGLICEKEGYVLRFKFTELWGKIMGTIRKNENKK